MKKIVFLQKSPNNTQKIEIKSKNILETDKSVHFA